jgi:hypothetical protein
MKNKNVFITIGASNHTDKERQNEDFYATDPIAIDILCDVEIFVGKIWECAAGEGHLSKRLIEKFGKQSVRSSDIIDRGYKDCINIDFLEWDKPFYGNIITNPPYRHATEFIYHALELIPDDKKVAMFLKVQFLEGKKRKELFKKYPPRTVYVSSSRLLCAKNGDFEAMRAGGGSAVAYAWFVWEKGYTGSTILEWVN